MINLPEFSKIMQDAKEATSKFQWKALTPKEVHVLQCSQPIFNFDTNVLREGLGLKK